MKSQKDSSEKAATFLKCYRVIEYKTYYVEYDIQSIEI